MNEAEYNEQNRRIEAEHNQRNADEFWTDHYLDGDEDGDEDGDDAGVDCVNYDETHADDNCVGDLGWNIKYSPADALGHAILAYSVAYEYSRNHTRTDIVNEMVDRLKRTFGDEQPTTPSCCGHCIN